MTQYEKLLKKFLENPGSLRLNEILKILEKNGFVREEGKGSHTKFINGKYYILVAIHNNDMKVIYKKKILRVILKILSK